MFPDFLIIGAQKCGTSSLYSYLAQHPDVRVAREKEIHFFDLNFDNGISWYESHFPASRWLQFQSLLFKRQLAAGEASPYYIFHPLVPQRVGELFPQCKLIVLLRNPVDRAFSHYRHELRYGWEELSFEKAIEIEPQRLAGENEKIVQVKGYYSFAHQHHSYLARGVYADQLRRWFKVFSPEQFLILESEAMYADPQAAYSQACHFLNLRSWNLKVYKPKNQGSYSEKMPPSLYRKLLDYFTPYNNDLFNLLKVHFQWK